MSEICPVCGLPKELCVCETIAKEKQKIIVKIVKGKYKDMFLTLIEGIDVKGQELKNVIKQLKHNLACGGNIRDNAIELQGDHRKRIKEVLQKLGFNVGNIEIRDEVSKS
ncbi:MAG: stress response translation initiation inhibitor YciH [Candidatus Nanoarchaeia archaeon]